MECFEHEKLEDIERVVKTNYSYLNVSYEVSAENSPYICIFKQTSATYPVNFVPLFYIIGTLNEKSKCSLKMITHHGKILKEVNEYDGVTLTDTQMIDFVGHLHHAKPCQGVSLLDCALKFDPYTFTFLYLVEQMGENIIIRSRQCLFINNGDRTNCDMCRNLDYQYMTQNGKNVNLININSIIEPSLDNTCTKALKKSNDNIDISSYGNLGEKVANEANYIHTMNLATKHGVIHPKRKKRSKAVSSSKDLQTKFGCSNFKCDICSFETRSNRNLIRHTKYNHQEKPHSCHSCSYVTASRSSLIHHIGSVHAEIKEFKCEMTG